MNVLMFRWFLRTSAALLILLWIAGPAAAQFTSAKRRPDPGPMPKNVHGIVQDSRGKPLAGARVFIRNVKTNVIRTLTTDEKGAYQQMALPPSVDYEVYAEFRGKTSDKRLVSGFLNRQDNVLNFQLDVIAGDSPAAAEPRGGPEFNTFDLVKLRASLDLPSGVPAPIPSVLLLHGYGENRSAWDGLKKQLLDRGWAVMSLDLRGHGDSKTKNGIPIQPAQEWRTSAHEFPQDLDPALDFLKSQPRLDNRKIVVIGYDIGADLALIASGRFTEVRTVVALNPKLSESLAMAGSAQDFMPRSALILTTDEAEGNRIRATAKDPARVQTVNVSGGTPAWVADKAVTDAIFAWLQQTF
jgi:pimeloyl-ACP methyl ester carboxylesterase